MKKIFTRRKFLHTSSLMAASASIALCGCGGGGAATQPAPITERGANNATPSKKRALVYLYLGGGNDSYNMLVPTDANSYNSYARSRSNLALPQDKLLALDEYKDANNKTFGLHPSMPEVQQLFKDKKLSFLANIGPLIEPTTKAAFQSGAAKIPLGLLSHADQFRHWQTSLPDQRINKGWFGRLADTFQPNKAKEQISMNISLGGTNILQLGENAREYSITKNGSVGLIINDKGSELDKTIHAGFNAILNRNYSDPFEKSYIDMTLEAQLQHQTFRNAIKNIELSTAFSENDLSQQFKMVASSIAARDALNMPQQTFFLHYLGWDHHDELLNNHAKMLRIVSQALSEFDAALAELGLEDDVITFTGSDFGRTLTSNGNGTDHGWGGNVMVMGKNIDGGKIYGEYPDLTLESDLDIGGGLLIPTLSTDAMFAELAMWLGTPKSDLKAILPNIERFYSLNDTKAPIGFIK